MRSLREIKRDAENTTDTMKLVALMNELERDYGVFAVFPTDDFLKREEGQLYRKISDKRIID